jgi:hypothetical protein
LFDMRRQCAQRGEDATVLVVVRTQLEAVALADRQRQFQRIDRIQPEPGIEQGRLRVDLRRIHAFQVQALDQQLGEIALGVGLQGHRTFHLPIEGATIRHRAVARNHRPFVRRPASLSCGSAFQPMAHSA